MAKINEVLNLVRDTNKKVTEIHVKLGLGAKPKKAAKRPTPAKKAPAPEPQKQA